MPDTSRLVAKIDEAIRALKPLRRQGIHDGSNLAQQLRERFVAGRPFEIKMGGHSYPVKCDKVRISRTTVDLGLSGGAGIIPLTRVTTCEHGVNDNGDPVTGFGLHEDDETITPVAVA